VTTSKYCDIMEIVTVLSYLAGKKHDFKACDELILMTYAV